MNRNLKVSKNMIFITITMIFLVIAVWFSEMAGTKETVEQVHRGDYGSAVRTERFRVEVDGKEEEVQIQISPRTYKEAEIHLLMQEALEVLDIKILGENVSFDHVDSSLVFPSSLEGYPFLISWELSRYDVLTLSGELIPAELEKADPEKLGVLVTITAVLVYEDIEAQYQREVKLFQEEKELTISEQIEQYVDAMDEMTREEEALILPNTWNGKPLTWSVPEESNIPVLSFLAVLIIILFGLREKQMESQKQKEKKKEMLVDYPEIISQFTMLMGAGMTAKKVWEKVAEDYKVQKRETGKTRAAYEEIVFTWQEMQSGVPEMECYERFAKRCELLPYMKMGVLLAQNLRKGSKGLSEMLSLEAVQAMEERKARARKLGEEAGTKLLIPMVIMLIVVFAIVIVPAFWSAQL